MHPKNEEYALCGKSTLIKIVTGVYEPDVGTEIEVFGERITYIEQSHQSASEGDCSHLARPRAVSSYERRRKHRHR